MVRTLSISALTVLLSACANEGPIEVEPRSEVDDTIEQHVTQLFTAYDSDRNGSLSKTEASTQPWLGSHFERADLDGDAQVTVDEAMQLASDMHEGHCEAGDCAAHGSLADHVERAFAQMDADGDDAVTVAEAEGHPLQYVFDSADADADGGVSKSELVTFAERMHGGEAHGHR
jgi:Ca2+-binding EF-hand superfamily protein